MNSIIKQVFGGVSWVLITAGGLSFFLGGRALHELAGVDRLTAELEGLAAGVVLAAFGVGLRAAVCR
jgi:hypothetical protein